MELAFYGAVERGLKEGRLVPLAQLPKTHRAVQHSILDLGALYASDHRVSFLLLHNLGTKEVICEPLLIAKKGLNRPAASTTLQPMNTTTFKQRLKLAKAKLRETQASGEAVDLTRSWSAKSLLDFRKALRGGSVAVAPPSAALHKQGKSTVH